MKLAASLFVSLVAQVVNLLGAPQLERSAILSFPQAVPLRGDLGAVVEFRWGDELPVTIDIWSVGDRVGTMGDLKIFDETGKEVPFQVYVSMPPAPSGTKEVKKGEVLKIALFVFGAVVQFPRAGQYYATAEFNWAECGNAKVRFTTRKCWFQVIDFKPSNA